jgi:hypothetical protein
VSWHKVAAAAVLLVVFNIANAASGAMVLVALLLGKARYASRVVHAMDCQLAAQLGYDGRSTVSKECGRQHERTTFCRRICRWLDWADEGHCTREGSE